MKVLAFYDVYSNDRNRKYIYVLVNDKDSLRFKYIVANSLVPDNPKNKVFDVKTSDAFNTFNTIAFRNFYLYIDYHKLEDERFNKFLLHYSNVHNIFNDVSANYIKSQLNTDLTNDFINVNAVCEFSTSYVLTIVNSPTNVEYSTFVEPLLENGINTIVHIPPRFYLSFIDGKAYMERVDV